MKEPWHKKVLTKYKKEIISAAIFSITFALALLLWHFALGKTFEWQTISPVSAPPLVYEIYSALTFITLGAFLYWIRFYQFLYFVFVKALGDWKSYREIKGIIWALLILLTYWLVQKIVDLINATISFFYNILNGLLYLSPPLGIALIASIIVYLVLKKREV